MKVSEIYYALQGEGSCVGRRVLVLRLFGCNFDCVWCDTKYARNGEEYTLYNLQVLRNLIEEKLSRYDLNHVLVTGGEPLLQQKELWELFSFFENLFIEVETNGSIVPKVFESFRNWIQFNVSPKLQNSKVLSTILEKSYRNLIKFEDLRKKGLVEVIYKFVIKTEKDMEEVRRILETYLLEVGKERIFLMPLAGSRKEYIEIAPKVAELALKYGFNFSPREHIVLYDRKRGV